MAWVHHWMPQTNSIIENKVKLVLHGASPPQTSRLIAQVVALCRPRILRCSEGGGTVWGRRNDDRDVSLISSLSCLNRERGGIKNASKQENGLANLPEYMSSRELNYLRLTVLMLKLSAFVSLLTATRGSSTTMKTENCYTPRTGGTVLTPLRS